MREEGSKYVTKYVSRQQRAGNWVMVLTTSCAPPTYALATTYVLTYLLRVRGVLVTACVAIREQVATG